MKGSCPKVWLSVPAWAPVALRGDWNWEPPRNWGSRIRPLCLGHCSGRMRHINIYKYEKFIPRRCVAAVHNRCNSWAPVHFKAEPQTPLKFEVCLDIFIFLFSRANLVGSGCSLVWFRWRRRSGAKCGGRGATRVSARTPQSGGWAERWEEEQGRPSFKSQTFAMEPRLGSILCIYEAPLLFVVFG